MYCSTRTWWYIVSCKQQHHQKPRSNFLQIFPLAQAQFTQDACLHEDQDCRHVYHNRYFVWIFYYFACGYVPSTFLSLVHENELTDRWKRRTQCEKHIRFQSSVSFVIRKNVIVQSYHALLLLYVTVFGHVQETVGFFLKPRPFIYIKGGGLLLGKASSSVESLTFWRNIIKINGEVIVMITKWSQVCEKHKNMP